jgi:hypothetical protein
MANPDEPHTDPIEMWIGSAAIVLLILAGMGIDMLISHNTSTGSTAMSIQSAAVPPE